MAGEVATTRSSGGVVGAIKSLPQFYRDVMAEMRKVTWPDRTQLRQLSIGVIVLSLFIGLVIFVLDWTLSGILVNGLTRLFGG